MKTTTILLLVLGLVALYIFTRPAQPQQPTGFLGALQGALNGSGIFSTGAQGGAGSSFIPFAGGGSTNNTGSGGSW